MLSKVFVVALLAAAVLAQDDGKLTPPEETETPPEDDDQTNEHKKPGKPQGGSGKYVSFGFFNEFEAIDYSVGNKDGVVNLREGVAYLYKTGKAKCFSQDFLTSFVVFDLVNDGAVNRVETGELAYVIGEVVFLATDKDKSGDIDGEELYNLVNKYVKNEKVSKAIVLLIGIYADYNRNQKLEQREFIPLFTEGLRQYRRFVNADDCSKIQWGEEKEATMDEFVGMCADDYIDQMKNEGVHNMLRRLRA